MNLDELTDDAVSYILQNIDSSHLSKWEIGFSESITEQWDRSRHLSDRQKEVLGKIWDKQP